MSKKASEELKTIIKMFQSRLKSLEESIAQTKNYGLKKVMQNTYVLNKELLCQYQRQYEKNIQQ